MRLGKCWDSDRKIQVDILAGLFGISAWLTVNSLFNQLPILVQSAPEGWNLPSYLSLVIQLGNIGPITYHFAKRYYPGITANSKLIYFFLFLGSSSLILMALFYDHTMYVVNGPHSVVLCTLAFCIALVGCVSSVLFIPFMNYYPEVYLVSYMVGEGLGGFLPSIISLVQGVGGNPSCVNTTTPSGEVIVQYQTPPPLFSTEVFFFIIFSIMAVSTISFFLLNNLSVCKKQKLRNPTVKRRSIPETPALDLYLDPEPFVTSSRASTPSVSPTTGKVLLLIVFVLSMLANGALPSVQSYSCLPYGNLAYHLAVNLGNMANPAACFIPMFGVRLTIRWMFILLFVSGVTVSYVLSTALFSPSPPLQGSTLGILLIVFCWVVSSGVISYVKLSIAQMFRHEGGQGLYNYGAMTQIGAAIGSVIMFYLINVASVFSSYDACR